ncbi:MAG: YaiO family outer membrane beta-barrel protein, partial [Proteobacteria bacterium]|nr:YaiO family outer membrane beta-barrel protein [Pseudomonadota bacterium]
MNIGKRTFTIVACLIGYALMQASSAAPSDLTGNVENAVSRRDFTTAMDLLNDHLVEYPDDNTARFKRAQVLGWAGNYTKARSEFDSLVAASPGNVDYVFGRARILARQGHTAEALREVTRARQLAPDYEAVWQLQFQLLAQQENATANQELTALRPEAEQRFPQANWLQASRNEPDSSWAVLVGLNIENLSDNLPGWNQQFLEVITNRSSGARYFLRAARHERFGHSDSAIGGGGDWQLAGEWFAGMNAHVSPSAVFQPGYEVGGHFGRTLFHDWVADLQYRRRHYDTAIVDSYVATTEHYFGSFRAAYSLGLSHLHGASNSVGHSITLNWYKSDTTSFGVSF